MKRILPATIAMLHIVFCSTLRADDWPQWMGPDRDGTYTETGLVDSIPDDGLPIKWRVPVNGGYAGPAVVGDRVYLMDYRRVSGKFVESPSDRPELKGFERVVCFDAKTGKQVWQYEYPCNYQISYPAGPRATPTIDDGQIVCLGAQGDLFSLSADGKKQWHINLPEQFGCEVPVWGFSAHPLVTKTSVVTMVGGDGQSVVSFDRKTGKVQWKALSSSDAGYCPASLITAGGTEQLIVWNPTTIASLDPKTGKTFWTVPLAPDYGMSISQPQRDGEYLFVSGIKDKSLMLKLADNKPEVTELWAGESKTSISVSTMTPIMHDGVIYGTDEGLGSLVAVSEETGERLWTNYQPVRPENTRPLPAGTCYVTRNAPSGLYWIFGETGLLTLAHMDAEGFKSHGQMQVVQPTQTAFGRSVIWSHPAYSGKTAFIRNDKELVAVDLAN